MRIIRCASAVGENPGSKLQRAKRLGVKIIDEKAKPRTDQQNESGTGDGAEVRARNILVQITSVKEINGDDKGRVEIVTIGSGEAIILKKGAVIYGTWKKSSLSGRTRFYDKNKKEILLAPGNTWVEVVPKEVNVQVTN